MPTDHWATDARVASDRETFASVARAAEYLLVDVAPPRATIRGRLSLLLEGAIERALDGQGAPPTTVTPTCNFDRSLDDLLRRAAVSGASGIALWIPSLLGITSAGVLDPADSSTLRAWLKAAREQAVKLGFHCENLPLGVHLEPLPLAALLRPQTHESEADEGAGSSDIPDSSDGADGPEAAGAEGAGALATEVVDGTSADSDDGDDLAQSARAMARDLGDDDETSWLREALMELSTPPPRAVDDASSGAEDWTAEAEEEPTMTPPPAPLHLAFAEPGAEADESPMAEPAPAAPAVPVRPAIDPASLLALESHCRELEAASGPKPLAVVERLFTHAYMPLRAALDVHAELPRRLRDVADEWSRSFEKSYTESFDALRVRAKRPIMLADIPDLALRVSRLHGARSIQLLLVDGMRHDLGEAIHEKLRRQVGQRAACADRFLLWAALPTTTAAQVELIGRGPSGLKDFTGEVHSDLVVARGRKASTIRRLKTGHRELLKLDVVEALLSEPGHVDAERLDSVADEAAQRIAAYFEGLQPRTLVMVFGDHGFCVDASKGGAELRQGGASPEEVLVSASAWLVGAMH